jgi:hypothetical protein
LLPAVIIVKMRKDVGGTEANELNLGNAANNKITAKEGNVRGLQNSAQLGGFLLDAHLKPEEIDHGLERTKRVFCLYSN